MAEHRIALSGEDILATRFATSQVTETVHALRTFQRASPSPYDDWARGVAPRMSDPLLRMLVGLIPLDGFVPPWFPLPGVERPDGTSFGEVAVIVEHLRGIGTDDVEQWMAQRLPHPPEAMRPLLESSRPGELLGEALQLAWDVLVAPWWPTMLRFLEADIAWWTTVAGEAGMGAMLARLHSRVTWDGADLVVSPTRTPQRYDRTGSGLLLVPTVFNAPYAGLAAYDPHHTWLVFSTRSAGLVFDQGLDPGDDGLAALLGRTRAAVLRWTTSPRTTSEISRAASMSMGTVSEHLGVLRQAGLVSSERHGREVLYRPTRLGWQLLEANPARLG
ncbi:MAG: ArsR/SmtB family transcription factor [Candidatus Nanopelagicales bacterium]